MNLTFWLMLMGMFLFGTNHNCSALECCIGNITLAVTGSTDTAQQDGDPCTNRGTSCKDIGCLTNTCTMDRPDNYTTCVNFTDCSATMQRPVCRLLYYELAKDISRNDDDSSLEPDLDFEYFAEQACFENMYDDAKINCEFYQKIFYLGQRKRVIYQDEKYTCWSKSSRNGDKMGFLIFTTLIIVAANCMLFR